MGKWDPSTLPYSVELCSINVSRIAAYYRKASSNCQGMCHRVWCDTACFGVVLFYCTEVWLHVDAEPERCNSFLRFYVLLAYVFMSSFEIVY